MVNYDGIKFIGEGRCPVNHQSSSQQWWQFSLFISFGHGSNNFWHEIQCHVRHRASIKPVTVRSWRSGSKIQDAQLRLWGHSSFNHQRKDGYFLKSIFGDRRMKQWPSENKVTAVCLIFFKEMQPSWAKDNPTGYQSQHMTKRTINVSYSSFGTGVILSPCSLGKSYSHINTSGWSWLCVLYCIPFILMLPPLCAVQPQLQNLMTTFFQCCDRVFKKSSYLLEHAHQLI